MSQPKREAFDAEIDPLLTQLYQACEKHGINYSAIFQLDHHDDGDSYHVDCIHSQFVNNADFVTPEIGAIDAIAHNGPDLANLVRLIGGHADECAGTADEEVDK